HEYDVRLGRGAGRRGEQDALGRDVAEVTAEACGRPTRRRAFADGSHVVRSPKISTSRASGTGPGRGRWGRPGRGLRPGGSRRRGPSPRRRAGGGSGSSSGAGTGWAPRRRG